MDIREVKAMNRRMGARRDTRMVRALRGRRFDRNPLRRASDRLESVVLIALLLAFGVGAPVIAAVGGGIVHRIAERNMVTEQASRYQVTATVLTAAAPTAFGDLPELTGRWTAPDGRVVTGEVYVSPGTSVGQRIQVWVTRNGQITSAPLLPSQVADQTETAAVLGVAGYALVLASVGLVAREALDRRRLAAWDAEWLATGQQGMPRI